MNAREAFEELEKNFQIIEYEIDEPPFNEDTRVMAINRTLPIIKRVIDRLETIEKRANEHISNIEGTINNLEKKLSSHYMDADELAYTKAVIVGMKQEVYDVRYILNGKGEGESK